MIECNGDVVSLDLRASRREGESTLVNPIMSDLSLKHCLQMLIPYFLICESGKEDGVSPGQESY